MGVSRRAHWKRGRTAVSNKVEIRQRHTQDWSPRVRCCAFPNGAIACETSLSENLVLPWTMFRSTAIAVIVYG